LGLGAVVVATLAVWLIKSSEALPDGPVPVVWNRTQCAECRMSVTDRAYAAQLQLADGRVLDFDDPGCLFRYERQESGPVHAVWFHHVQEERWLAAADVGFVVTGPSPMGYDLGAVEAGAAGSIGLAAARVRLAASDNGTREDARAH